MGIHRRALLAIGYAFLFIPLVVLPYNFYPFTTGKSVALRILAGIGLFVWSLKPVLPIGWIGRGMAAVLATTALSVAFAEYPDLAFFSSPSRREGFINMLAFAVMFLVLIAARPDWRTYIAVAVGVAVLDALIGLGFHYVYLATQETRAPKIHALAGNASYLGLYLAMSLMLTLWLWMGARERRERITLWPWPFPTKLETWAMVLAGAVQFYVLTLTQSRGAILALGAGVAAALLGSGLLTVRYRTQLIGLCLGTLAVLVLATLPWNSVSIDQRLDLWEVALGMIWERPWTGWGPDGFFQGFINRVEVDSVIAHLPFDRAHNWILDRLILAGLPGLAAYLLLLWAMYGTGNDPLPRAVLTCYLVGNLWLFDFMETSILFWMLAAYLVSRDVAEHAAVVAHGQPSLDGGVRSGRA